MTKALSKKKTKKAPTRKRNITNVSGLVYAKAEDTVIKELPQKKVARTSAKTGRVDWCFSNVDLIIFTHIKNRPSLGGFGWTI